MAEEKKESGAKKAKAKKHLHQIITTQAHDKTFSHEHVYKDHKDDIHHHPPVFAGTSSDMSDLHSHMDDHFGPQAEAAEEAQEGEGGDNPAEEQDEQQPAAE